MKFLSTLAVCIALAAPLSAIDDCAPEITTLQVFYDIRSMIIDGGASSYEISSRIEEHLETLREPLPEGGYRWVRFVKPKSGSGPVIKREHLIEAVQGEEAFDSFEAASDHVYAVKIAVPRKRSLLHSNKEAYVGTLKVRYWVDGEAKSMTRDLKQWLKPDTSKSFDIGVIADRAEAEVEAATRARNVRESLVELHFVQAVAQDDPGNPHADAVSRLKKLKNDPTPKAIDDEIARLESEAFGSSYTAPLTQIAVSLREADDLMSSDDEEERERGRTLLDETLKLLR